MQIFVFSYYNKILEICVAFCNNSQLQVVRLVVGKTAAGHLYSHLIPLVLLLIDGNFITYLTSSENILLFSYFYGEKMGRGSVRI